MGLTGLRGRRAHSATWLLEEATRADLEHQHGALIEAAVQRAIHQTLGRLADLAFRAALDSDETRRLAYGPPSDVSLPSITCAA